MSDRDPNGQMSDEVEELLDRASAPEPAPSEARERVWSSVTESLDADIDADGGEADGGSATPDGTTSGSVSGTEAASTAGSGVGQWFAGGSLVQTVVSFLVGTTVGAGGYALLQSPPEPDDAPERQVAPAPADTGLLRDTTPEAGPPDTGADRATAPDIGVPDTGSDDTGSKTAPPAPRPDGTEPAPEHGGDDSDGDAPTQSTGGSDTGTPPPSTLSAERTLLSRAQSALARGRPDEVMEAVDAHARRFPDGQLAEERRALAIQALMRQGRRDEARRRAREFLEDYPNSIFRETVSPALGERSD